LADWNVRYEDRYGFIFLICATGKSASEMLHALQARMEHPPEDEVN
jgi:2-oxo-4-hydroxy-4-carboxy--5-ureidoimidazoline (OHCU) decarboxylase